jgi:hypothetical protein
VLDQQDIEIPFFEQGMQFFSVVADTRANLYSFIFIKNPQGNPAVFSCGGRIEKVGFLQQEK